MLGEAGIKKIFLLNILNGACIKKFLKLDMLGGADVKKLNSKKMLDVTGIEKASLTHQCVRWGWREKLIFTENVR